jgi:hypothetical protein
LLALGNSVVLVMLLHAHSQKLAAVPAGRAALYGPLEGSRAPVLTGLTFEPGIGRDERGAAPALILFVAPRCRPCLRAREAISEFADDTAGEINLVLNVRGSMDDAVEYAAGMSASVFLIPDHDGENAALWHVNPTPFAVAVDAEGIVQAKRASITKEDLAALTRRAMPPRKGVSDSNRSEATNSAGA